MGLLIQRFLNEKKYYKLSKQQQTNFISLLSDLLMVGFTTQESLLFMKKSQSFPQKKIGKIIQDMEAGKGLGESIKQLGFSSLIAFQIEFSHIHGDLNGTLKKIGIHLKRMDKQRQKLYQIISYPSLLFVFLISILLGIRQIVLPQLLVNGMVKENNIGIVFIKQGPYYLLVLLLFISGSCFYLYLKIRRKTAIQQASILAKIPSIGKLYKIYISAFFALEWGKLFAEGMEMRTVLSFMQTVNRTSLFSEVSKKIEYASIKGETIDESLERFPFFLSELVLMVQQGEIKGKLGKELVIYSDLCWQKFFEKFEKMIQWIQPIIFIVVAFLIVSIYMAMLLPIYSGMEELL